MTSAIIVTICMLLLVGYVFDLTASKTRIPAVILLLLLGWAVRQASETSGIVLPDLQFLLPILGTIGLILIVLEGSLELELDKSKAGLVKKSFMVALLSIMAIAFGLAFAIQYFTGAPFKHCLINAIPFSIISSSVAIPTARNQSATNREFVVYESSLSDIIGVLFFNFVLFNTTFDVYSYSTFGGQIVITAFISLASIFVLTVLLNSIDHHIKFVPIILLVILIYEVAKEFGLPSLLFILLFGLFLGNLDRLKDLPLVRDLKLIKLKHEVHKLKELTMEAAFLVRALFFILFGYLINTSEILNAETALWAAGILSGIFIVRLTLLKVFRLTLSPLLYLAPRGLITILLYLAISPSENIALINNSLVIQVVVISSLCMMLGTMGSSPQKKTAE